MSKASSIFETFLIVLFSAIIITVMLFLTGVLHLPPPAGPPVKYGFINTRGQIQIGLEYDSVGDFHQGLATVKKDGKLVVIDRNGKETNTKPFSYKIDTLRIAHRISTRNQEEYELLNKPCFPLGNPFSGKALYRILRNVQGSKQKEGEHVFDFAYAFIDLHNPGFKPVLFEDAFPFSDSLALVHGPYNPPMKHRSESRNWGFIDTDGKYSVYPIYQDAHSFSEGLAAVAVRMNYHSQ